MKFTNSPFERMMQEVPRATRPVMQKAPVGSICRSCSYWRGTACIGICYRELTSRAASPNMEGSRASG